MTLEAVWPTQRFITNLVAAEKITDENIDYMKQSFFFEIVIFDGVVKSYNTI